MKLFSGSGDVPNERPALFIAGRTRGIKQLASR
jgi:hypothetical protein